jgi:hypothetical protein
MRGATSLHECCWRSSDFVWSIKSSDKVMILIYRLRIINKFSSSYFESSTEEINTFSELLYALCFENVAKEGSSSHALSVVTKSLAELPNTVHSCSRQGLVAARLASERPGSVIHLSKNICSLGAHY